MAIRDEYSDDRLREQFGRIEKELDRHERRLDEVDGVKAQLAAVQANLVQMVNRMDRFREDTKEGFAGVNSAISNVSRTQNALLVALLAAMLGALVVLVVAL